MLLKDTQSANPDYLDITVLNIGEEYTKVAYLSDAMSKISKVDTGFYTFYFKDCNSNLIVGRLFNIEKFIESGLVINILKRKLVNINFIVQEYNGSLTLVIKSIEPYSEPVESEDVAKFIGLVPNVGQEYNDVTTIMSRVLGAKPNMQTVYATKSFASIYNGKCGGYAKLLNMVVTSLVSFNSLPDIDIVMLFKCLNIVQADYFTYLVKLEDVDVLPESARLEILFNAKIKAEEKYDVKISSIAIDTLSSLFGLTKPQHLYAHLIYTAFETSKHTLRLTTLSSSMVLGSRKEFGGDVLLKY